jgi:hypothetical protein
MVPRTSVSQSEHAAILNQMQAMRLAQQQQNIPSQPVNPADYASIQNQMQAMQRAQSIQPPYLPHATR